MYWNQRSQTIKLLLEGFIFLPFSLFVPHLAPLSRWLESRVCGPIEYLLDKVLHLKGNCIQMLACYIWLVLHMWFRPDYISPDRSLVLPDETFLAAERPVCLMWLYRLSETLKLCCFLFLLFLGFLNSTNLLWQFDIKQMLWKLDVRCHHHRTLLIIMIFPSQLCHV